MSDGSLQHSVRVDGGFSCGPAFTADERTLVNLGSLGNVSIWRIGSESASCTELDDRQNQSRRVSSDGRWLVFGRRHKNDVAVWAADAENETISLRRSFNVPGRIWSVAVTSGEEPSIAYSKWDGTVFVRDVTSERVIYQTNLPHTASWVSLSNDGRYLAAYSHAGLVLIDLRTRTTKEVWGEDCPEVRYLGFSAEADLLLAGLGDGTARGWDVVDGRAVMIVDADNKGIVGVALSRDRSLVATVAGGHVKVWECDLTEGMANTNQSD
jgi:WD40 repeat protein